VYRASPAHRTVCLGAQPVWEPAHWASIISAHASLRGQLHRAANKGVRVEEWAPRAGDDPRLRALLHQWLGTRGLPPLHFLVEPDTLSRLFDRRLFVARRGGEPVAFLVASPIPARNGWLIEQIVRGLAAPNGCSELLVDAAMRALAAGGADYVTLGLAPLSRHAPPVELDHPLWMSATLAWIRAHGRRFYNFDGLDTFKAKMRPHHWEPVFAIAAAPSFPPRMLYAIAGAFGGSSPPSLLVRALARATAQEARWLAARARRRR
jgi:phosphatidylglycerol lysyltransferase